MSTTKNNILEFENKGLQSVVRVLAVLAILFFFLVSLNMMGGIFKTIGKDTSRAILTLTSNPFVGLFMGLLATAIIQSSSTTTSLIVTVVASGIVPVEAAVPMIMGANIGTSVTSTIVSLGHVANKNEFRNAIAGATVHDIFNILVTIIILPLELAFGFLSGIARAIVNIDGVAGEATIEKSKGFMDYTVKAVAKYFNSLLAEPWIIILISFVILFFSLRYLTVILKSLLIGKSEENMQKAIFGSPLKAVLWGTGLTAAVQSSSVTTSMTVPLVATGKLSLKRAFPFLLGANIGTTVTALLASIGTQHLGVTIALCHFLFNTFGVLLFMLLPFIRTIPVKIAEYIGSLTLKNRIYGFGYILIVFFVIPAIMIFFSGIDWKDVESTREQIRLEEKMKKEKELQQQP